MTLNILMLSCPSNQRIIKPMKLQRQQLTRHKLQDHDDNDFVAGSMRERLEMVWEITREVASLSPNHDVERILQRHIVRVTRAKG